MQFEVDSAADMQGKLATDQVQGGDDEEEDQPQMLEPSEDNNSNQADEEMEEAE